MVALVNRAICSHCTASALALSLLGSPESWLSGLCGRWRDQRSDRSSLHDLTVAQLGRSAQGTYTASGTTLSRAHLTRVATGSLLNLVWQCCGVRHGGCGRYTPTR